MPADHSSTRIAFVPEVAWGEIPATPSFQAFRTTRASGLRTNKTTAVSDEIRADRNVADEFILGLDCAGDYPVELSYGSFDPLLEGLLFGTWTTNVLKNAKDRKSFTFEETRETNVGTGKSFSRFAGAMVNRGEFTVRGRQKIEATFGLMAKSELLVTGTMSGATYAAASAEPILTASKNVAALSVVGAATPPKVMGLSFTIDNGLRVRPLVGDVYSTDFGVGRCEVTGSMDVYFESNELYQKVLDHGGGALSFTAGAAANKKYTFAFPKIIFLNGNIPQGGNTDDVMVTIPFRAVYDATEACSVKITRAVA
ncbi:phage tail tube protein [Methylopila sp. 73B]|uniref:phage tail tube protein n=1 Tax=Methylopila sp. 73B TaxID=1120792 RepID=UPI00036B5267|nr:phage tail tube protein [Methylopila sp. 73B]